MIDPEFTKLCYLNIKNERVFKKYWLNVYSDREALVQYACIGDLPRWPLAKVYDCLSTINMDIRTTTREVKLTRMLTTLLSCYLQEIVNFYNVTMHK